MIKLMLEWTENIQKGDEIMHYPTLTLTTSHE